MSNILQRLFPSNFDLRDIDLEEIQELAGQIPKDGHVDLNTAEDLARSPYSPCLIGPFG